MIGMRPTRRLGNYFVYDAQLEKIGRRHTQRGRGTLAHLRALAILPQDCRAAFDCDHGVNGVLHHQHAVGDAECQRPTRSPFADYGCDYRDRQLRHLQQIPRNRLGLSALLGANSRPRSHRVDERQHRDVEFFRKLHQPQRLPVPLWVRHAEVPLQNLLGITAALLTHHHDGLAIEARPTANDRRVVPVSAVAMQLDEVGENELNQLGRERSLHVSRDLYALPRAQVVVYLVAKLGQLLLEWSDLLHNAELLVAGKTLELVNLPLQLDDRLLEIQGLAGSRHYLLPRCKRTDSVPSSDRRSLRTVLFTASVKVRERSLARNPLPSL